MDDWNIALWYRHPGGRRRRLFPDSPEEIFIVGPSGARSTTAIVGTQIVDFLIRVGVELTPGSNEREFDTPSRRKATEQSDQPEPE
jgi:hypothetical protein